MYMTMSTCRPSPRGAREFQPHQFKGCFPKVQANCELQNQRRGPGVYKLPGCIQGNTPPPPLPAYKPRLKCSRPLKKPIRTWPEEAESALQDCFMHTDWKVGSSLLGGPDRYLRIRVSRLR